MVFGNYITDPDINQYLYSENLTLDKYKYIYIEMIYADIVHDTAYIPVFLFKTLHHADANGVRLTGPDGAAARAWYDGNRIGVVFNCAYWPVKIWGVI